ncbi:acyltransferase [Phytobacter diazotrophicus]|uniref:acyltransferase family protein n=1 Tax=Phytobacter diazotrophicus TaxID=395631 RepID=UPI002FFA2E89
MLINGKLKSLQILRGLAALSVVLFHYRFYMVPDNGDMTTPDKLFGWGAIGVDLFFVISGFIMVYITHNRTSGVSTWSEFIKGRLLRILPVYYVILLITFFINGAMSTFHYQEKTANLISAITFTPYLSTAAPFYVNPDGMYNIRWTLNYEMYFYLVFSLCLLSGRKIIPLVAWIAATVTAGFFATGAVVFTERGYQTGLASFNFLTNPIILEFLVGVMAGYLYFFLRTKDVMFNRIFFLLSVSAVCVIFPEIKAHSLYTAFASAVLILFFTLYDKEIVNGAPAILIKMGDVSFSWYLTHNPFIQGVAGRIEHFSPEIVRSYYGFVIFVILSFLVACLSHKYLEVKMVNKLKKILSVNKDIIPV